MLYDNAQLLELLALAQADAPDDLYRQTAENLVGWLLRDMRAGGAFAASEDADSDGEEGRFYVWTEAEIGAVLGEEAAAFKRAYDVTAAGNWEGKSILRRVTPPGDNEPALAAAQTRLLAARDRRVRPARDDKVLADWNALMIVGLVRAGLVFDRPDRLEAARAAFEFVLETMGTGDGRVAHAWRAGMVSAAGLLDDQASMARAALALFEATGAPVRLRQAIRFADAAVAFHGESDGSFFTSATDAVDLPGTRPRTAADHATPSGNGLMAEVFARLFLLTGQDRWRAAAERTHPGVFRRPPGGHAEPAGGRPVAGRRGCCRDHR